jgi:pSer/pThr/pTyr-binding forkhead associated (FHA) protein/WD40 repeat protein
MTSSSLPETNEFGVPSTATCAPSNTTSAAFLKFNDDSKNKLTVNETSRVHKTRNFLLLGRQATTCDIRITHKSLSRQHTVFYYDHISSSLCVIDLNTKTGTFVNQERISPKTPTVLQHDDVLQFGKAQPTFTVDYKHENNSSRKKEQEEKTETTADDNTTTTKTSTPTNEENPTPELTGRAKRQAEIAAMMATLEEAPAYTKYEPTPQERLQQKQQVESTQQESHPMIDKHRLPFPETSPITESTSSSVVANRTMDPSGTRFAIAHMDSSLLLYDFAGWSSSVGPAKPFANVLVEADGHPIRSISYSPNGDRFVVATHSAQPKIFDKEGEELLQWVRGDVYVTDPTKTIGHTAVVTAVSWHALEKSLVFSTSRDGSLRVWHVDAGKLSFGMLKCQDVVLIKNPKTGRKTIPTCMVMVGPSSIWLGTECGSVQRYQYPFVSKLRPQHSTIVENGEAIICIAVSGDGTRVAARTKTALYVYNNTSLQKLTTSSTPLLTIPLPETVVLEDDNPTPTMDFSPNGKTICMGVTTIISKDNQKSYETYLQMYSIPKEPKIKKKPMYSMPLMECQHPLVGILWHPKLNQILVTTTKEFQVCYSQEYSKKGMLLNLGRRRQKRRRAEDDLQDLYSSRAPQPGTGIREDQIIAPNALPLFGGQTHRKKKLKDRQEEQHEEDKARHKPQPPAKGVYNTNNTLFAQMVMDNRTANIKIIAGIDPREALAQYSEGKSYIGTAYEGNKERILTDKTVEEEEDEMKNGKKTK